MGGAHARGCGGSVAVCTSQAPAAPRPDPRAPPSSMTVFSATCWWPGERALRMRAGRPGLPRALQGAEQRSWPPPTRCQW